MTERDWKQKEADWLEKWLGMFFSPIPDTAELKRHIASLRSGIHCSRRMKVITYVLMLVNLLRRQRKCVI
jgi:hypothetical protein